MLNKNVEFAISSCREVLVKEIRKTLEESGGRVEVDVDFPCTIDEDRYHTQHLSAVLLLEDGSVAVESSDDIDAEVSQDPIELYSVDQMLEIVEAL